VLVSVGSNGVTVGALALPGSVTCIATFVDACGGLVVVSSCRSVRRPTSKPLPFAFGANTCRRLPSGVPMKPFGSGWKLPAREYTRAPLSLSTKKPSPSIATSSPRPVGSMLPCENCCATLLSFTPEPIALRDRP